MRIMTLEEFINWTPEEHSNCSSKVVRAKLVGSSVYVQYALRPNGSSRSKPMLVVYTAPVKK